MSIPATSAAVIPSRSAPSAAATTTYGIIFAVSLCHFINDTMQSLLSALYPVLKETFSLDFWQIGMLTMCFMVTASLLQPVVGIVTDRRPMPWSLPLGMASTLIGLLFLAFASTYGLLLVGAGLIGVGSAIFHPESSRVARLASGGRYGFAQSTFQVGGNFGHAVGPLLAAFIVVPRGQASVAWFCLGAFAGILILARVGAWYRAALSASAGRSRPATALVLPRHRVMTALVVLMLLTFTKNIYTASFASFYTFYVIERFGVSVPDAQFLLFVFLGAGAVGTFLGGPIGDRFGARFVIWFSILGVLPFSLALPYASYEATIVLTILIGLILSSAFPAILVFAQELVPGRVGMVAGIFFGFAFGMGGIAAAVLGVLADKHGIQYVYWLCSFLPFLGLLTVFLPATRAGVAKV